MKDFIEKYFYPLILAFTLGGFGYVIRFEVLASEVEAVQKETKTLREQQNLVAWLLCEDAIKKGEEEAIKRCKEVLKKEESKI